MGLSHKIRINVEEDDGEKKTVLEGGICRLPSAVSFASVSLWRYGGSDGA